MCSHQCMEYIQGVSVGVSFIWAHRDEERMFEGNCSAADDVYYVLEQN